MFKNKFTILYVFIILGLIGLAVALFGFRDSKPSTRKKAELEIWGVFENTIAINELIKDFGEIYKNVKISYFKKNIQNYERDLLEAMAEGKGPDIIMMHHTWLPRYLSKILPAPANLVSFTNVQDDYVDVVANDFVSDGLVYGLPLSMDTLALYYNKDIFNTNGIAQPPATWENFLQNVEDITVKSGYEQIVLAGAAIGTANNINRSTDILSLLMIQSGVQMTDEQKTKAIFDQPVLSNGEKYYVGERSLLFYTDFANSMKSVYTWNNQMNDSIDAFLNGDVAMMLNYSYWIPEIKNRSPYLNFDIALMPQIETSEFDVNYANYWGMAVSRNTSDYEMAWQFIDWLSQKQNTQKYLEIAKLPTARRDLIALQSNDSDLGVFAKQSLTAYSWHQINNTTIEKYLANMIESVVGGKATIGDALSKAANEITLLMQE